MIVLRPTRLLWTTCFALVCCSSAFAANRSWQGQVPPNWGSSLNWTPIGAPISTDDVFIGDLPQGVSASTVINQDFDIASLTLTSGADADTDGNRLDVFGDINISGGGVRFTAAEHANGPTSTAVTAEHIDIASNAQFVLEGGRVVIGASTTGPKSL